MEIPSYAYGIVLVILVVVISFYYLNSKSSLSTMTSATTMQTVNTTNITNPNSSNFTFSIWFYINNWNYNYDQDKIIYARLVSSSLASALGGEGSCPDYDTMKQANPSPMVALTRFTNDLEITMSTYSNDGSATTTPTNVRVANVPLQKWVNLLISIYGRTLDIYLDGKLIKTVVLPNTVSVPSNENMYITPCGGFNGWTSNFQYFPHAFNPQQAWNIYRAGYGSSFTSNLFGQTQMNVTLMQNGTPTKSITL